ncbi:hypothetical protein NXY56_004721 [Leishmania guyanensis]
MLSLLSLQVETMYSLSSRVFLYTWHVVLVLLVVQSSVRLQRSSCNLCGTAEEVPVYHLEEWSSSACLACEAHWMRQVYTWSWSQGHSQQQQQQWVLLKEQVIDVVTDGVAQPVRPGWGVSRRGVCC